jgi:RNA processing factor Prp31
MKTLQRERTPLFVSDAKNCARHLVRKSLDQILAGTFQVPSYEEMISILDRDFEHTFDEFMARRKIMKSHLSWSRQQIDDELENQKIRFENELRVNLRVAALKTIEEIENLVKSLNQAITEWKIENL